jgi:hypothetical protein
MNKYELEETDFQIAFHEGHVVDQENIIAYYESKLKTAPADELDGIRSAISYHEGLLDTFQRDLDKWKKAKVDDVFPSHGLG